MTPLCPLDQQTLQPIPHGASAYHACPACHGLWLERLFLNNLVERRWIATRHNPPALPEAAERAAPLACPACRKTMLHRKNGRVQIDLCPGCRSVWLDGGEIDLLVAALPKKRADAPPPGAGTFNSPPIGEMPASRLLDGILNVLDNGLDSIDFP